MSDVMRVHGFSVHVFHRFLLKGWREGSREKFKHSQGKSNTSSCPIIVYLIYQIFQGRGA